MNDHTGGWRAPRVPSRLRQASLPAATLAALVWLTAACGGASSPAAAGTTAYQKAIAYAQCMRAHGEPGFPDPTSNGNFIIDGRKDHLNGALMPSASRACQHLMPNSAPMTAAQQRTATSQALKYVACMRSHGLPTFPDPVVSSRGVQFHGPPGIGPNSAQFQSAQQACRKLLPGLGGGRS